MEKFVVNILNIWLISKYICSSDLPKGFVYLNQIDPTIIQSVMYNGIRSFVGERITSYKAPTIILTEKAALKLKNVQEDIRKDNHSLVVYDGYRPTKAVDHSIECSNDT